MRKSNSRFVLRYTTTITVLLCLPCVAWSQVTVKQALALAPVQKGDVTYSVPSNEEQDACTISFPKDSKLGGWVVKDPAGRLLRRFLDTNGDKDIDLWCYYLDGFEVYRDIDSNFDRKADQYRWFGSQGTRWGVDSDQDGEVDSWKRISAEEVSAEIALALRDQDSARFNRLLLGGNELASVGFGEQKVQQIRARLDASRKAFFELAARRKTLFNGAKWVHFGGLRPGLIPEGSEGAKNDILIYENVAALVRSGTNDIQVSLGTLVQSGPCWRLIDAPELIDSKSSTSFASWYSGGESGNDPGTGTTTINAGYQKLLEEFQELDREIARANTVTEKVAVYTRLAETTSQLAIQADSAEDSLNWSRQFADTVTAALQNGDYPDGLASLKDFLSRLKRGGKDAATIALVEYRYINAEFGAKLADSNADVGDAQVQWLAQLRDFTEKYPTDENVPDAMMQLAMSDEFEGKREAAEKWYQSIATKFSKSQYAGKARGAIRRLDSVGKPMQLRGRTLGGETVDINDLGGNVVLVHYWADWCDICKKEFTQLEQIRNAHPRLKLIGINCDNDLQAARQAAEKAGLRWPQLHSTGGYNSGLAAEMGIVSLPSMILVDQAGKILSTTVTASTLERELKSISK